MRISRWIITAVFAIPLAIAGYFIGQWALQSMRDGAFLQWQALGSPSEKPVRIADIGYELGTQDVFVEAGTGKIYHFEQSTWQLVEKAPTARTFPKICGDPAPQLPTPPGKVISCGEISAFEWIIDRTRFVLLDNGTVWRIWHHVGMEAWLIPFLIGPLIGAFIGGLFARLILYKNQKKVMPAAT